MPILRVRTLGGLSIAAGDGRVLPIAGSCRPVLGYLLAHRRRAVPKQELAEALWSDRDGEHARHCLATALWRLRKSFAGLPQLAGIDDGGDIRLDGAARVWVDAVAMEARLGPLARRDPAALSAEQLKRLRQGVRLYRGDYLAGMDQEWAWLERQRLRDLYCDGLYQLVTAHAAAADWHAVLTWGRLLSREEPLREDVHRALMLACLHTGNRASAIAQYRQCRQAIAQDLGIEPMAETRALYQRLLQPARAGAPAPAPGADLDHVRERVDRVQRLLVLCQRQLDAAADQLARSDDGH